MTKAPAAVAREFREKLERNVAEWAKQVGGHVKRISPLRKLALPALYLGQPRGTIRRELSEVGQTEEGKVDRSELKRLLNSGRSGERRTARRALRGRTRKDFSGAGSPMTGTEAHTDAAGGDRRRPASADTKGVAG